MNELPKIGMHVVIDAWNLERVDTTGHPRLLKNLLSGTLSPGLFSHVEIDSIKVTEQEPQ